MPNYFDEKKTEWGKLRKGKFTGSRISELLERGTGTMFGKGAMTYITQMACDEYTEYEHNDFEGTWEMREGKRKEPEAAKFYSHIISSIEVNGTPLSIKYYGESDPFFKEYNADSGVTADMVVSLNGVPYFTPEFKCPKRSVHFDRLRRLKKYKEEEKYLFLKENHKDYYGQIQFQMMCWGVEFGHWVSYNEYFPMDERAIIIHVPADKPYQKNLDLTLKMAISEKRSILNELKQ